MKTEPIKQLCANPSEQNTVQNLVMERVKEGVLMLSRDLQLVYLNQKAKELYQQLWNSDYVSNNLPPIISDVLNWLRKNPGYESEEFVTEFLVAGEKIIRIRGYQLRFEHESDIVDKDHPWLLLFLEDRKATLQDELQIEQRKYNLTDREIEVLGLLSHSCSYQEVSSRLQVSLNTVKFHVKNINLKKQIGLANEVALKL